MKTRTKVILGVIAAVVLIGPFAIPVNTSGVLTNREAAALSWDGESQFVDIADHSVHLVTKGDPASDTLIVLLHGFGASALTWKDVLEPLSAVGLVVAYDRAAFGFTERPTKISDINPYSSAGQLQVLDEIVENSLRKASLWEEVKERLHQPGTGLSGGQQQRLCIARAIAVSPEVILMDEPCSALDPIATAKIEELIEELSENFTIAIVTHSMQQAARVSHRTAYFHLGKLIEVNPTEQVFTMPEHQLTEAYITGRFG